MEEYYEDIEYWMSPKKTYEDVSEYLQANYGNKRGNKFYHFPDFKKGEWKFIIRLSATGVIR